MPRWRRLRKTKRSDRAYHQCGRSYRPTPAGGLSRIRLSLSVELRLQQIREDQCQMRIVFHQKNSTCVHGSIGLYQNVAAARRSCGYRCSAAAHGLIGRPEADLVRLGGMSPLGAAQVLVQHVVGGELRVRLYFLPLLLLNIPRGRHRRDRRYRHRAAAGPPPGGGPPHRTPRSGPPPRPVAPVAKRPTRASRELIVKVAARVVPAKPCRRRIQVKHYAMHQPLHGARCVRRQRAAHS